MITAGQLLLTEREAARSLGVSQRTLVRLRAAGEVPYLRVGVQIRYPADSLREWIGRRCQGGQHRG